MGATGTLSKSESPDFAICPQGRQSPQPAPHPVPVKEIRGPSLELWPWYPQLTEGLEVGGGREGCRSSQTCPAPSKHVPSMASGNRIRTLSSPSWLHFKELFQNSDDDGSVIALKDSSSVQGYRGCFAGFLLFTQLSSGLPEWGDLLSWYFGIAQTYRSKDQWKSKLFPCLWLRKRQR